MISISENKTKSFAKDLLTKLSAPAVLALEGDLGAGKTTFTQGLAKALGISLRVLSPTFVFIRSYKLENQLFKTLYHVDLYRCQNKEDVRAIGLEEILNDESALVAIEWPKVGREILPKRTIWIDFTKLNEKERQIKIIQKRESK